MFMFVNSIVTFHLININMIIFTATFPMCISTGNQWRSQTFSDGRAHYFYKILSITYKHAGLYVHLLKGVVCTKMHTNSS